MIEWIKNVFSSLDTTQIVIGIITTFIIPVLIAFHVKVIKPVLSSLKKILLAVDSSQKILDLVPQIEKVIKEFRPNGGSSFKDSLDRIESSVKQQEYRFTAAMQIDKQAMFECDIDGNLTWCNVQFCRLVKRSFDEVRGFGWANCIKLEDREPVKKEWENARRDNRSFSHGIFSYVDPNNGSFIKVLAFTSPLKDSTGKTIGHIGILSDAHFESLSSVIPVLESLSETLKAKNGKSLVEIINSIEQKIVEIEKNTNENLSKIQHQNALQLAKMQAFLQDDERGIFESNEDGQCVWVNLGYQRITHRSWDEIKGSGWINIIAPEDRERIKSEWLASLSENRTFCSSYSFIKPDGSKVKVECHTILLKDTSGIDNKKMGCLGFITVKS